MTAQPDDDAVEDGYSGPAALVLADTEIVVSARLRGYFQPIDGYYHWYGRIAPNTELSALLGGKKHHALLRTPHGEAGAQVLDPDPWDRYRVTGTSTPPFAVARTLADVERVKYA